MFDLTIYEPLLYAAKCKINSEHFTEYDIVHSLYLDEVIYDYGDACKKIVGLIKKEISSLCKFIVTHQIFDDTYVCSKCHEGKPVAAFRLRNESRETYFDYINDTCRECEKKIVREWRLTVKDTSEYKIKNRENVKRYRLENRDADIARQKDKRSTPEYKLYVREYYLRNREKIRQQVKDARKNKRSRLSAA